MPVHFCGLPRHCCTLSTALPPRDAVQVGISDGGALDCRRYTAFLALFVTFSTPAPPTNVIERALAAPPPLPPAWDGAPACLPPHAWDLLRLWILGHARYWTDNSHSYLLIYIVLLHTFYTPACTLLLGCHYFITTAFHALPPYAFCTCTLTCYTYIIHALHLLLHHIFHTPPVPSPVLLFGTCNMPFSTITFCAIYMATISLLLLPAIAFCLLLPTPPLPTTLPSGSAKRSSRSAIHLPPACLPMPFSCLHHLPA